MSQHRDGSIEKSARLVILMKLQDVGKLTGMSGRQIAAEYFPDTHFTTIARDLRDVARLKDKIEEMEKK